MALDWRPWFGSIFPPVLCTNTPRGRIVFEVFFQQPPGCEKDVSFVVTVLRLDCGRIIYVGNSFVLGSPKGTIFGQAFEQVYGESNGCQHHHGTGKRAQSVGCAFVEMRRRRRHQRRSRISMCKTYAGRKCHGQLKLAQGLPAPVARRR